LAIEQARKSVAKNLGAKPAEIFFTSGGTESSNTVLNAAIADLGCKHIISSPIEHHATLHTVTHLAKLHNLKLSFVQILPNGHIDMDHLAALLAATTEKTIVTIMHANNEIGTMIDIAAVGQLCKQYGAYFHSDTVQTVGHFPFELSQLPVDFITGAGHKFHGPKGVGILYINENVKISPLVHGGSQERNMRGGTENVYGIIGLAKALELAYQDMQHHQDYILSLKKGMITGLKNIIPDVKFNGESENLEKSLYTVLNVSLPPHPDNDMLLFNLDIQGVCASGGSACSSGSEIGSHVLRALKVDKERGAVRFSFSRFTTQEEIKHALNCMANIFQPVEK
jgi:cysteine desulfurase